MGLRDSFICVCQHKWKDKSHCCERVAPLQFRSALFSLHRLPAALPPRSTSSSLHLLHCDFAERPFSIALSELHSFVDEGNPGATNIVMEQRTKDTPVHNFCLL